MPRNGSGVFSLVPVYLATPGEIIMAEQHNAPLEDIANGLSESLPRSGVAPMTGNLAMNGYRITGLPAPLVDNDAARRIDTVVSAASETVAGKVELATAAETVTGTDTVRAVHPAGLAAAITDSLSSTALTGTPTAPTPAVGDDSTKIATTAFVHDEVPARLNASGAAPMFACRAWVDFSVSGGVVTINGSGNVASVVRSSAGIYVITFTVAMPDDNYALQATGSWITDPFHHTAGELPGTRTASVCRIATGYPGKPGNTSGVYADASRVGVAIFR